MNIGQIKILSWAVAALLTLGLSAYVWSFVSTLEDRRALPAAEDVRKHLSAVEPVAVKNDGQVKYEDVRRLFHDLNWTGAVKVVVKPVDEVQRPLVPEVVPVRDLVRILSVQADLADPTGTSPTSESKVFLKYKPKAQVDNKGLGGYALRPGDALLAPHSGIRVESITTDGVAFAFADESREKEMLLPSQFDASAQIVQVGPDGIVMPTKTGLPRSTAAFVPGKTTPLGRNRFQLGTEDMKFASDNYLEIMSNDVRLGQHRDPRTGRYDGIEITDVKPGSFAERHGAQSGDVVKSINGHPVISTQEAITFFKTNKDKYSTWEIVIENKGKTRTVTFESN